jgi:hypothetical protein
MPYLTNMLDSFSKKEDYQLVVDQTNFGILTAVQSLPVAHAVSLGIPNTSVMNVLLPEVQEFRTRSYRASTTANFILVKRMIQASVPCEANVALQVNETQNNRLFDVIPMAEVTPEWTERRRLANARANGLITLEQKIERYMARAKTFSGDEIFIPFIAEELKKGSSPAIEEWANIRGVTVHEARVDLEIKVKTAQLVVSNLNAVWEKYVERINSFNTFAEINNCLSYDVESSLRNGTQ